MRSIITLFIICLLGYTSCNAQTKESVPQDTTEQMNLLDEQVNVLGSVFDMGFPEENPFNGATDYLELIEKMEVPESQKQELREQYKLLGLNLDPRKKDSLSLIFNKKLQEAIEKGKMER